MKWFNKKRGLALGILEAGFGFGQMLIVPGSLLLIHYFDWRFAILLLGIFLMVVIFPIVLLLIRNHPDDKGVDPLGGQLSEDGSSSSKEQKEINLSIKDVLRQRHFWFLIIPFGVCGFTTTGLMDTHLIPFAQYCGFSPSVTSAAVSLLAAFNIIGILLSGVVIDYISSRKLLVFLYFTRAISIVLLLFVYDPILLIIFAVLFGLVDFATVAPTQLLATQYFKKYSIGFIVGCLFFSHQIGSALGSSLPGFLYSEFGSCNLSFYLSIILLIGASVLNFLLPEPQKSHL
jgi:sugar phosphate permease